MVIVYHVSIKANIYQLENVLQLTVPIINTLKMVFAIILTVHVKFMIRFNLDVISVDLVLLLVQMEIVLK